MEKIRQDEYISFSGPFSYFRPGFPFRSPEAESFVDIVSVPLFVKVPNQQMGTVLASNVETVDIVPTLAARLGSRLPKDFR